MRKSIIIDRASRIVTVTVPTRTASIITAGPQGPPGPPGPNWGTVTTPGQLPVTANLGEQFHVQNGLGLHVVIWTGTAWITDPVSDTGWHTLTSWTAANVVTGKPFGAGWGQQPNNAGDYRLRRCGDMVMLRILKAFALIANPTDRIFTANAGFTAEVDTGADCPTNMALFVTAAGIGRGANGTVTVNTILSQVSSTYPTADAWPTTTPT